MMSDDLMARFRAAQERVIEAWAVVLDCYATGQKGDGDWAYVQAAAELAAFVREMGKAFDPDQEVRFCQSVGSLRAADRWQNPPYSDVPGLPEFLRRKKPLVITEEMLRAP